jgi:integral membrane protein (TIGR01906 family)
MNERVWPKLLHVLVIVALPLALLASSFRLTTGHWLVRWEYHKADFPADPYGLSTAERIRLSQVCVDYLISGAGIELLEELRLEDGQPAFNERELRHMIDTKRVLWAVLRLGWAMGLIVVGSVAALASRPQTRRRAPLALWQGGLLGLGLLAAVGLVMALRWDFFFDSFHELLFPPDTWTFYYSDTLIRLYPVRFWMDVAIVVVSLFALQSAAVVGGAWLWYRQTQRPGDNAQGTRHDR